MIFRLANESGPEIGDPVAQIIVGIGPLGFDFGQQLLRPIDLLHFLLAGRKANLLIAKLPDDGVQIIGVHLSSPTLATLGIPYDFSPERVNGPTER